MVVSIAYCALATRFIEDRDRRGATREERDVSGFAGQDPASAAGLHHGAERRDGDLRRAGAAQQPARPFPAGERPRPARSLLDLYGEQRPLHRVLQRPANARASTTPASTHI